MEGDFGHFARVLIDIDLSQPIQDQIILDCEGSLFDVDVSFENLPQYCNLCHSIGHASFSCRLHKSKAMVIEHSNDPQRGRSRVRKT